MAVGRKPGTPKTGGRKKDTPNKDKQRFRDLADAFGYTPGEVLIRTAAGKMPCGKCEGKGKTNFQESAQESAGVLVCKQCWGSGWEPISAKERAWADAECCQMIYPRMKAVEMTGEGGGPVRQAITVEFVNASHSDSDPGAPA
jgi:hypothetical protein